MSKEANKTEEEFYLVEELNALDFFVGEDYLGEGPIKYERVLYAMYIERQSDDQWQCVPSRVDQQIKYEIIETGRDELNSFPYYVREWQEVDAGRWAYTGEGIFCKTLEQANEYIAAQDEKAAHGNIAKIKKSSENIREVPRENGENKYFIKKYNIWWPASKNEKDEIYPNIMVFREGNDELMHNNLKRMMVNLENAGVREIDFSHWNFDGIIFDESMLNQMKFADKISFQNANFSYSAFRNGELKNVDFTGASFGRCIIGKFAGHNCNFSNTVWGGPDADFNVISDSVFRNCNFSNTVWGDPESGQEDANFIENSSFTRCSFKNAKLNSTKISGNKFVSMPNIKTNVKISVLDKLKENQRKVKSRDTDRDTKQRDRSREDREER